MAGIIWALSSCTDERPNDAGAGNTDTASSNTMVGTGNGGNTYNGGDTSNLQGGNATGQAADSANRQKLNGGRNNNQGGTNQGGGNTQGGGTNQGGGSGTQQRPNMQ